MSEDTLATGSEPCHRFDFFEADDQTALVCLDVPQMQRLAIDQLTAMGYKIHTGLFLDDSILKLRTHEYDVVVVSEHFSGSTLEDHGILAEANRIPMAQRRRQRFVLIGASLTTNDELQAFGCSVDVVLSLQDLGNLRPVLRRSLSRAAALYAPLNEALSAHQGADGSRQNTRNAGATL
ncbi:MAG: hypothetical protein ACO1QR_15240 [Chthoniobacteraceae bacterium]